MWGLLQRGQSEEEPHKAKCEPAQTSPANPAQNEQLLPVRQEPQRLSVLQLHPLQQHGCGIDSAQTPVSVSGTCTATHFGSNQSLVSPNTSMRSNMCSQGGLAQTADVKHVLRAHVHMDAGMILGWLRCIQFIQVRA